MVNHQVINNLIPFLIFIYLFKYIYVIIHLLFSFSLNVIHVFELILILRFDRLTRVIGYGYFQDYFVYYWVDLGFQDLEGGLAGFGLQGFLGHDQLPNYIYIYNIHTLNVMNNIKKQRIKKSPIVPSSISHPHISQTMDIDTIASLPKTINLIPIISNTFNNLS